MTSILKVDTIQNSTGTDALSIDSNGQVSLGSPILFSGVLNYPSTETIDLNEVVDFLPNIDTNSAWDSTNKQYVVPKTGYYRIDFHLLLDTSSVNAGDLDLVINGVIDSRAYTSADAYQNLGLSVIRQLTASDTVRIQGGGSGSFIIWSTSDTNTVGNFNIQYLG